MVAADASVDISLAVEPNWRPWTPKVGQRVRIRLSEECEALWPAPGVKEKLTRYHSRSEDGMVGEVIQLPGPVWHPRDGLQGHGVLVDFSPNSIHFQGCISFCCGFFAPVELEPLDRSRQPTGHPDADLSATGTAPPTAQSETDAPRPNSGRRTRASPCERRRKARAMR